VKILLSAYACEPGKGSEPGVGWHWARAIAGLGHETWVLTRAHNRPAIEAETARHPAPSNLRFVYYDLPRWAAWWKKGHRGIRLYYVLWQWGAYRSAREVHGRIRFDIVHHVTFVSVRQPSFMGNLGIPFIFGPVAGGEAAPWRLRFGYSGRGWVIDGLRDLSNFLIRIDPLMRRTFRQAQLIYTTTEETYAILPKRYQVKTHVQLAVGNDGPPPSDTPTDTSHAAVSGSGFRLLYVGRFLYWKGMHLGLPAFAGLLRNCPDARLTLVGNGPEERRWRALAAALGVEMNIDWLPWVSQSDLPKIYIGHDVLFFPSLHDSGGMVVLEALRHGLPVVCMDLGGPGVMVDETCGRVIRTQGRGRDTVVNGLTHVLTDLAQDPAARARLASGAWDRVRQFDTRTAVRRVYEEFAPRGAS
jgi:glycosyltransferase involved in cell wall biosynthesis